MHRDLVARVIASARERLFEDVQVQVGAAEPVTVERAISGIVPDSTRLDMMGQKLRTATHVTRGIKAALPGLAKGHRLINDEGTFAVVDIEPVGDGRFEIAISLDKVS